MKNFILAFAIFSAMGAAFPQKKSSKNDLLVQFAKGDISQKTAAVKKAGEDSAVAKAAFDFVLQNSELLKNDRDMAALAVAAVLSFPLSQYRQNPQAAAERLKQVFFAFDDVNVRVSVFEKAAAFYAKKEFPSLLDFANEYLSSAASSKKPCDDAVKKCVEVLSQIGNAASFYPLYSIAKGGFWPDLREAAFSSLVSIAEKTVPEIAEAAKDAEFSELKLLFEIYEKNSENPQNFQCETAQILLSSSMLLEEKSLSKDLALFELECAKILSNGKWTRNAELGSKYFSSAKSAYEKKLISKDEFAMAIGFSQKISSRSAVRPFSEFLDQMNKSQESGNPPDKAVVLAVINALGELGDKSAFDCLLYVTYLDYSEDIAAAARNALTRLKW